MSKKDKFLAAAQKFLEKGSLEKALAEFQRAAQEDPKDTRTWLRIAEIHVKRGENAQATSVYLRTADLYVEQGFFQRAVAVYKNVIKLSPGHTDAHFKLADIYKQLGLFSDAAQQYDQAATALQRAGKLKEAMGALAQIVELHPDQVMARVKLAEVAAQAGQNEDALREWSRAAEQLEAQGRIDDYLRVAERLLTLQPENYILCKKAAVRYLERQNPRAALAKLQVCFNALPRDPETLSLLANAFAEVGQVPKTISVLKELVKVHEDARQYGERAATVQRILALDPNDPIAHQPAPTPMPGPASRFSQVQPDDVGDFRGGLPASALRRHQGGRRDAAITFSELAIPPALAREPSVPVSDADLDPDLMDPDPARGAADAQRIIAEADIFVKYGLTERAAEHLRRVFDLDPDHAAARERLAALLVQLGRKAEAVEELGLLGEQLMETDPVGAEKHLRRALELDPSAAGARYMLDRLKKDQGRPVAPTPAPVSVPSRGAYAAVDEEELDINDVELQPADDDLGEDLVQDDSEAAPATTISDRGGFEGFKIDIGGAGATRVVAPSGAAQAVAAQAPAVQEPEEQDEWGGAAQSTQIESAFHHARGAAAPAPAAMDDGDGADDFAAGGATMFVPGLDLELESPPAASARTSGHSHPQPPPSGAVLDDLDLGFEVGTPTPGAAAGGELPSAVASDLEQVDFFLEQELADEARSLLDDLPVAAQDHPDVRERRARLSALEDRNSPATQMLPASASLGAVPGGRREKSITPRAVVTSAGGADATTVRDLGIAYKEMGLHDAAIAEFAKLVDDPLHEVFALTMMGECYEARGTPAEALKHYKQALNRPTVKDDEATQLYYQLGRVFHAVGDQSEALYFFEKVYRRNPRFGDVAALVQNLRAQGVAPHDRAGADPARLDAASGRSRR